MPSSKPAFVADAMLKNVWRWLKLFGADCEFSEELGPESDEELVRHCLKTKRILLTKDAGLYAKARDYVKCALVPAGSLEEQIVFVAKKFRLSLNSLLAKCPTCGGKVVEVKGKEKIRGKVFPRVYSAHREFWLCRKCGQVFWKGSHWPKLRQVWKKIEKLARAKPV